LKGEAALIRFLVKVVMNGIILVPLLLWYTEANVFSAIVATLLFSVIAYLVGDRLILRSSNNLVATVSDAILAVVYLWAASAVMHWSLNWGELLFTAVLLGVVELLYHFFLKRFDTEDERERA
jgi:FtsH-binding integral membrane protein